MAGVNSCTPTRGHGLQLERSVAHRVEIASSPDCSLITNPALVPWALLFMLQAALALVRSWRVTAVTALWRSRRVRRGCKWWAGKAGNRQQKRPKAAMVGKGGKGGEAGRAG